MKKKKVIALTAVIGIIVISVIIVSAVNRDVLDSYKNNIEKGKPIDNGELVKMIKDSNVYNTPYEKLTKYSYNDFMFNLQHRKWSSDTSKILIAASHGMNDIISFNSLFPIEKLTVINDDCIFAEYKLEKENVPIHTFVVFERDVLNEDGKDFEIWQNYGEIYFAYPELISEQLSDFEGKRVAINGLPFVIDMRSTPYTFEAGNNSSLHFEETILIKDGVVVIDYTADSLQSNEITINTLTFIPYGKSDEHYLGNSFVKNSFSVFQ